jgi:hypothetical protein
MKLAAVVAGVSLLASGCSFAFVSAPPPPSPTRSTVRCDGSILAPIGDTLVAAVGAAIAYGGLFPAKDDDPMTLDEPSPGIALLGLATLALYGASAAWGYIAGRDCRQAKAVNAPTGRPKRWGAQRAEEAEEEAAAEARARELAAERGAQERAAESAPAVVPEPVVPPRAPDAGVR